MSNTMSKSEAQSAPQSAPLAARLIGNFDERFRSVPVLGVLALIWLFFYSQNPVSYTHLDVYKRQSG